MNLRQKYKRAKRRIEMLENRPVQPVLRTEQYKIDTYAVSKYIDKRYASYLSEEDIKTDLIYKMVDELLPYAELLECERTEGLTPYTEYRLILKVAKRKGIKEYD